MTTSTDFSAEATHALTSAVGVRRYVNREIARVGGRFDGDTLTEFDFLCECGSLGCRAVVKMTLAEFGRSAPGSVVAHA